jgi:hypothetical protein
MTEKSVFEIKSMKKILFYDTTLRDGSQAEGITLNTHPVCVLVARYCTPGV